MGAEIGVDFVIMPAPIVAASRRRRCGIKRVGFACANQGQKHFVARPLVRPIIFSIYPHFICARRSNGFHDGGRYTIFIDMYGFNNIIPVFRIVYILRYNGIMKGNSYSSGKKKYARKKIELFSCYIYF